MAGGTPRKLYIYYTVLYYHVRNLLFRWEAVRATGPSHAAVLQRWEDDVGAKGNEWVDRVNTSTMNVISTFYTSGHINLISYA